MALLLKLKLCNVNEGILMMKLRLSKRNSWASMFLDLFRVGAAILVVLNHFRSLFFENFQDQVNPSLVQKLFYLLTSLGHEAVMVFFCVKWIFYII